jgi:tRNA(Ile)-lysidine synthase
MIHKLIEFADQYEMLPENGHILAAVSGGADSMCLLSLLADLAVTRHFSLSAVHFNHNLRGAESDGDAAFTETYCRSIGIPCYSGSGDVAGFAKDNGLGLEEAARRLRYDFLEKTAVEIDAHHIATAHTADDNAETILMNLARGTGLRGLCGIPPVRGQIVRPMLTITRREIEQYLFEYNIPYREDSSNQTDDYTRNIIRHHIIPVMKQINSGFLCHVSNMTQLIHRDHEYLERQATKFYHCQFTQNRVSAAALSALPLPIASRVISLAVPQALTTDHIQAVLALATSSNPSGAVSLPGITICREYDDLVFGSVHTPLVFQPVKLYPGTTVDLPMLGLRVRCEISRENYKINKSFTSFLFKYEKICGMITIRSRQAGDTISLVGRNCTKTLKKLFIERHIPQKQRGQIPIIADSKGVLAVYRVGMDRRAVPDTPGEKVIKIAFEEII